VLRHVRNLYTRATCSVHNAASAHARLNASYSRVHQITRQRHASRTGRSQEHVVQYDESRMALQFRYLPLSEPSRRHILIFALIKYSPVSTCVGSAAYAQLWLASAQTADGSRTRAASADRQHLFAGRASYLAGSARVQIRTELARQRRGAYRLVDRPGTR